MLYTYLAAQIDVVTLDCKRGVKPLKTALTLAVLKAQIEFYEEVEGFTLFGHCYKDFIEALYTTSEEILSKCVRTPEGAYLAAKAHFNSLKPRG